MTMRISRQNIPLLLLLTVSALLKGQCVNSAYYYRGAEYFKLKRDLGLHASHNSSEYQEIKGTLNGKSQLSDSDITTLSISFENDFACINTSDDISELVTGNKIRCIVKNCGPSQYELVAFTYEAEAAEIESKAHKKENKTANIKQKNTFSRGGRANVMASRGSISTERNILSIYSNAVRYLNPRLSPNEADTIARCILGYSGKYGVDPRLVVAVIWAESGFSPTATSHAGAMGLGQLMPGTAAGLGVANPYDPAQNLEGSIRLISGHLRKISGGKAWSDLNWDHLRLALASYNAGSGAVRKYGGIPPYRETRNYIARVSQFYKQLCGIK